MEPPSQTDADFERLLRPELAKLYRLAFRWSGNAADAEDLVQDVLLKVYERRTELTSIVPLAPWLARVLYNQFVDNARRYARQRLRTVPLAPGEANEPDGAGIASDQAGPEQATTAEFDRMALGSAVAQLSLEHRMVIMMHDAEGYKLEEIQVITGIALGTLKSRLHRARARLREILEQLGTF